MLYNAGMSRSLQDKVIVITGASSGIGAQTARACARAGMHVVLAARREEKLAEVAAGVRALGREAVPVVCDVTRDEDLVRLFEQAMTRLGRVDAIFSNAGYGLYASVLDTTPQQMEAIFQTNYFASVRTVQLGMSALRATASSGGLGHVLICSSAASEIAPPMYGAYAATKAAQDAIACAMRAELAGEGIVVTSIHPIGTESEFSDKVREVSARPAAAAGTPPMFKQSGEHVARCIVRALRKPRAEVWPHRGARLLLALFTACPGLAAWFTRRHLQT